MKSATLNRETSRLSAGGSSFFRHSERPDPHSVDGLSVPSESLSSFPAPVILEEPCWRHNLRTPLVDGADHREFVASQKRAKEVYKVSTTESVLRTMNPQPVSSFSRSGKQLERLSEITERTSSHGRGSLAKVKEGNAAQGDKVKKLAPFFAPHREDEGEGGSKKWARMADVHDYLGGIKPRSAAGKLAPPSGTRYLPYSGYFGTNRTENFRPGSSAFISSSRERFGILHEVYFPPEWKQAPGQYRINTKLVSRTAPRPRLDVTSVTNHVSAVLMSKGANAYNAWVKPDVERFVRHSPSPTKPRATMRDVESTCSRSHVW